MTRALQKHVARRQDQTFADWFAEAGERWADVADQAPTVYAVWGGGATPAQVLYMAKFDVPDAEKNELFAIVQSTKGDIVIG